jgi:hypothetical protein
MRRLHIGKVLDCFAFSLCTNTCVCIRSLEDEEEAAVERKALVSDHGRQLEQQVLRLRDLVDGTRTLGFHLEPKVFAWLPTCPSVVHLERCSVCSAVDASCLKCFPAVVSRSSWFFFNCEDGGAQGVDALQCLRQESSEAHLQNGRYEKTCIVLSILLHSNVVSRVFCYDEPLFLFQIN